MESQSKFHGSRHHQAAIGWGVRIAIDGAILGKTHGIQNSWLAMGGDQWRLSANPKNKGVGTTDIAGAFNSLSIAQFTVVVRNCMTCKKTRTETGVFLKSRNLQ